MLLLLPCFFCTLIVYAWLVSYSYRQCEIIDPLFTFSRGSLEGKREQKSYKALLEDPMLRFSGLYQENCSDLYVTCQVFAEGKPLALPVRTSYKAFSTRWKWVLSCFCILSALTLQKRDFGIPTFLQSWNEWLRLPVKYPDLPQNAQVALTVWDIYGPGKAVPVGGTTVTLFGKYGWAGSLDVANTGSLSNQISPRQSRFFIACSGKGCMTWKCGREWKGTAATPPPRQDGRAAALQRTRWADSPRYAAPRLKERMYGRSRVKGWNKC